MNIAEYARKVKDKSGMELLTEESGYLNSVTPGTAAASKAVVLGATRNLDTLLFNVAAPAAAGATQGTATALTADSNFVTGATDATGVKLPTAVAGRRLMIMNTVANKILKVYPTTGAAINGLGANNALDLPAGSMAMFYAATATQWWATVVPHGITASATEINKLDGLTTIQEELGLLAGMPIDVTQTAAAGAANVCEVTIQVVDKDNAPLAGRFFLDVWLSDSASGEGLTSHAADSLLVKAASGTKWLPANASYVRIQTKADGSAIVQITDTHKTLFNVCVQHALWTIPNVAAISAADKYGA